MNDSNSEAGEHGPSIDWSALLGRIRSAEPGAVEELDRLFARGVRLYLGRFLKPDQVEEGTRMVLAAVLDSVRRGEPRDAARFPGIVWVLARRQVDARTSDRKAPLSAWPKPSFALEPEDVRDKLAAMMETLAGFSPRQRDALRRFYLDGETTDQVCRELGFAADELQALRARARELFQARTG
jgi:DNA-directed RNA polymerase specialized sigma24 family protein